MNYLFGPQENPCERLAIRVAEMVNSPRAQLARQVTIHRLDTDPPRAWDIVMEGLAEADLDLIFNDDGSVTVRWGGEEASEELFPD